jgi:hypothetical protein
MKRVTLQVLVTVPDEESIVSVEAKVESALSENQYHGLDPSAKVIGVDPIPEE